ncbi:MAG: LPXTG cell wall anchor domain-containing protein [Bacteroidia bacterium]|nr:LPXTG cell wall anchor domain-containing protein [Bacteroidia bacterium]
MKRAILMISMAGMLFLSGLSLAVAQDQPSATKDSVNADKAAKPVFYDAAATEEAPKSNTTTYILIAGAVVVLGAAGYILMKKKKN